MPRWRWLLLHMTRRLWFRASLIALAGVITAIVAIFAQYCLPWDIPGSIGADAVGDILNIIATSMLSVATFSLSVMITAYDSATSDVTPRATRLLMEDSTTQNVLSTFVGAFLFSIVGIVALKTGLYGDRGRVILFVVTIAVIILIVVSLLRWIDHLTRFGRVGATTARVEEKARHALEERLANPWLGGVPLLNPDDDVPFGLVSVPANVVGHVQHVDMDVLSLTTANGAHPVHVVAPPGTMVYPDSPLAWIAPSNDVDENVRLIARARTAFSIGNERDFDQDPRFCLAVLAEIGERALSSATNDPGTALDVIGRQTRLLALWSTMQMERVGYVPKHLHVHVPALRDVDLFDDAFTLIARDGAHLIEIQLLLQKSLEALARMGSESFRAAARHQADNALMRAKTALVDPLDRKRLLELIRPADTFATVPPHTEC